MGTVTLAWLDTKVKLTYGKICQLIILKLNQVQERVQLLTSWCLWWMFQTPKPFPVRMNRKQTNSGLNIEPFFSFVLFLFFLLPSQGGKQNSHVLQALQAMHIVHLMVCGMVWYRTSRLKHEVEFFFKNNYRRPNTSNNKTNVNWHKKNSFTDFVPLR